MTALSEHPRDCPHGHQWGKCDTCDLAEALAESARLAADLKRARAVVEAGRELVSIEARSGGKFADFWYAFIQLQTAIAACDTEEEPC